MREQFKVRKGFWLVLAAAGSLLAGVYTFTLRPLIVNPLSESEWKDIRSKPKTVWPVDARRLRNHVEALSALEPARNARSVESLERAAEYIRGQWREMGFEVHEQEFVADGQTYRNLSVEAGPPDGELIVIGAHYDVCEEQPGADDNASGVAGLLEVSRWVKANPGAIRSRLILVAFTLEEPPYYATPQMGSLVFAEALKAKGERVKLMLSLEMIGYFRSEPGSQGFPNPVLKLHYPSTGNFIALVSNMDHREMTRKVKKLMIRSSPVDVHSINAPPFIPGIDFSDHRSFWAMGYPAVMVTDTSFYRNPNYHKTTDVPESLDYESMAGVVSGVIGVVRGF